MFLIMRYLIPLSISGVQVQGFSWMFEDMLRKSENVPSTSRDVLGISQFIEDFCELEFFKFLRPTVLRMCIRTCNRSWYSNLVSSVRLKESVKDNEFRVTNNSVSIVWQSYNQPITHSVFSPYETLIGCPHICT